MANKYNFIYKTTNQINGKVYIGIHSTNKLNDGYIGNSIYSQMGHNLNIKEKQIKVSVLNI